MRLDELIGSLDSAKVVVRGRELTVRAISALESSQIDKQLPRVGSRKCAHPDGAAKGLVIDNDHPDTIRERDEANRVDVALRCAIGLDIDGPSGKWRPDMTKDQAIELADAVCRVMTWRELSRIVTAQRAIVDPPADTDTPRIGTEKTQGN